ncbi:MAG: ubiquinone/menaquinone biosynthesis methyltransferase [Planctomycetes bacterium]|nr:ubiquinone/menaquinone biosynthesis methyltransferase [Planctomycetota bacterium]
MSAPALSEKAPTQETRGGSGAMFDAIAERYDLLNRILSLGLDQSWRRQLVEALGPDPKHVLDVATGTGDVARAIAARYPRATVIGLDPSGGMLRAGAEKFTGAVSAVQGDGQVLPFPDDAFSSASIAFGIRNVPDRSLGLREMRRVVVPGGPVAILELGEPRGGLLAPFARFHVRHVVPTIGALLSGKREYRYLQSSVAAFPPPEEFVAQMEAAGLKEVSATRLGFGAAHLYLGRSA